MATFRIGRSVGSLLLALALVAVGCGGVSDRPPPASASRPASASAYVGNRSGGVVHKAACRYASQVKPAHRVAFDRLDNALAEGFRPCSYCLPRSAATRPASARRPPR